MATKAKSELTVVDHQMSIFWLSARRFGQAQPQYKGHAVEALNALERARLRIAKGQSIDWKKHPAVQRLVLDMFECYGVILY
jgi:hypothetical protein